MLSGCKCYNIIWKQLYDGSSKVVVTYIVAVHNKVPPHPCPSDDTNQRHTCVRHLVGVVAVAVFALELQLNYTIIINGGVVCK